MTKNLLSKIGKLALIPALSSSLNTNKISAQTTKDFLKDHIKVELNFDLEMNKKFYNNEVYDKPFENWKEYFNSHNLEYKRFPVPFELPLKAEPIIKTKNFELGFPIVFYTISNQFPDNFKETNMVDFGRIKSKIEDDVVINRFYIKKPPIYFGVSPEIKLNGKNSIKFEFYRGNYEILREDYYEIGQNKMAGHYHFSSKPFDKKISIEKGKFNKVGAGLVRKNIESFDEIDVYFGVYFTNYENINEFGIKIGLSNMQE